MLIRLQHPKHGFHNVYSEQDAELMRADGWEKVQPEDEKSQPKDEISHRSLKKRKK